MQKKQAKTKNKKKIKFNIKINIYYIKKIDFFIPFY